MPKGTCIGADGLHVCGGLEHPPSRQSPLPPRCQPWREPGTGIAHLLCRRSRVRLAPSEPFFSWGELGFALCLSPASPKQALTVVGTPGWWAVPKPGCCSPGTWPRRASQGHPASLDMSTCDRQRRHLVTALESPGLVILSPGASGGDFHLCREWVWLWGVTGRVLAQSPSGTCWSGGWWWWWWCRDVSCLVQPLDGKSSPDCVRSESGGCGAGAWSLCLGFLRRVRAVTERALFVGTIPTVHAPVGVQAWGVLSRVSACSVTAEGLGDLVSLAGHPHSSAAPLVLRLNCPRNRVGWFWWI